MKICERVIATGVGGYGDITKSREILVVKSIMTVTDRWQLADQFIAYPGATRKFITVEIADGSTRIMLRHEIVSIDRPLKGNFKRAGKRAKFMGYGRKRRIVEDRNNG